MASMPGWVATLNEPLATSDPALFDLIEHEKDRQRSNLVLIASEVSWLTEPSPTIERLAPASRSCPLFAITW
jgi:hypothetical protein